MSTPSDRIPVTLRVNGVQRTAVVSARRTLADFLRIDLELTGTKLGCEHGVCGACTVALDGEPVRSCLMLTAQVDGREVRTVEGLAAPDGTLHPVQEGFREATSFQCGFCAAGFAVVCAALLENDPDPDEETIRRALAGNLCRCTGYQSIVDGVRAAARRTRENA
jgi:aerobic carbon-monoxide dehydrogenase small subunit